MFWGIYIRLFVIVQAKYCPQFRVDITVRIYLHHPFVHLSLKIFLCKFKKIYREVSRTFRRNFPIDLKKVMEVLLKKTIFGN